MTAEKATHTQSRMSALYSEFPGGRNRKRVGRGPGSGRGKTATRGNKGAGARSGFSRGNRQQGFRILMQQKPKFGFTSRKSLVTAKLPLSALKKLDPKQAKAGITLALLKANGLINKHIQYVRIYLSGSVDFPVSFSEGIKATRGVLAAASPKKSSKAKADEQSEG